MYACTLVSYAFIQLLYASEFHRVALKHSIIINECSLSPSFLLSPFRSTHTPPTTTTTNPPCIQVSPRSFTKPEEVDIGQGTRALTSHVTHHHPVPVYQPTYLPT